MPLPSISGMPDFAGLTRSARDARLTEALLEGLPRWLLEFVPVTLTHKSLPGVTGTVYVSPDWLLFGTPEHRFRVPLKAKDAWRVARTYGCVLATGGIVRAIHAQAPVRIPFRGWRSWIKERKLHMDSTEAWVAADVYREEKRAGRLGLVSDGMKDIVTGHLQSYREDRLVIVGGWNDDGTQIQPLYGRHSVGWGDYSQGGRLVREVMDVEDASGTRAMPVQTVLTDRQLCPLLADPGEDGPAHATGLGYT